MFGVIDNFIKDMKENQQLLTLGRIHNEVCPILDTKDDIEFCQKIFKKKIINLIKNIN